MPPEKNAPNLGADEMVSILTEEDVGCLCMSLDDQPYAVPVSYALLEGRIVFHCAPIGRKLDVLRQNPRVCFVVDRHPDRTRPHQAEGTCTYRFESVLCFGTARIVDKPAERRTILQAFQNHFYQRLSLPADKAVITATDARRCSCVVIDVARMTGRRKGKPVAGG